MPFLTKNIRFRRPLKLSLWRAISVSSWHITHDSSVIAVLDLDAEPALAWLAEEQAKTKSKLTLTHYAGWIMGQLLQRHAELNCMVRWGRLYPRVHSDVCFLVASGNPHKGAEDLSGIVVRQVERKSIQEVAEDLQAQVTAVKQGKDLSFRGIKGLIGKLPHFLRRPLVNLADFIMHSMNLWTPLLGMRQDAFGSVMLTSVGSLDIEFAIARIYPQSRNSLIMSVGAVRTEPVVRGDSVVPGKKMRIAFTVDHRIVDGIHGAYMLQTYKQLFERSQGGPRVPPSDKRNALSPTV